MSDYQIQIVDPVGHLWQTGTWTSACVSYGGILIPGVFSMTGVFSAGLSPMYTTGAWINCTLTGQIRANMKEEQVYINTGYL